MRSFVLFGLLLALAGCGPSAPTLPASVPAGGTVKMDEKPLEGAIVTFMPVSGVAGNGASATTDKDGKYQLATVDSTGAVIPGVIPGNYKVFISQFKTSDGKAFVPSKDASPMNAGASESIPATFSDPATSQLSANVPATGAPAIDFNITSKGTALPGGMR